MSASHNTHKSLLCKVQDKSTLTKESSCQSSVADSAQLKDVLIAYYCALAADTLEKFPTQAPALLPITSNAYGRAIHSTCTGASSRMLTVSCSVASRENAGAGTFKTKATIGCESCELYEDCCSIGRFFCVELIGAVRPGDSGRDLPFGFITRSQSPTGVKNG